MNNRLQELLSQAISDVDYIRHGPGAEQLNEDLSQMFIPDCFAEQFAELIVRDCISIAKAGLADPVVDVIKEHFGVDKV